MTLTSEEQALLDAIKVLENDEESNLDNLDDIKVKTIIDKSHDLFVNEDGETPNKDNIVKFIKETGHDILIGGLIEIHELFKNPDHEISTRATISTSKGWIPFW